MNIKEFDKLVEELTNDRKKVAEGKREDYTKGSKDVLANFKNQSEDLGIRPEQSLAVHMEKQFSAVLNFIKSEGQSESEPIIKRIGDSINYLELLWGLLNERGLVEKEDAEPINVKAESDKASNFIFDAISAVSEIKNKSHIYKILDVGRDDAHYWNRQRKIGNIVKLIPEDLSLPLHTTATYRGVVKDTLTGEVNFFDQVLLERV